MRKRVKSPHGGLYLAIPWGETLRLELDGKEIKVTPLEKEGCYCRLAIRAPREVYIERPGYIAPSKRPGANRGGSDV